MTSINDKMLIDVYTLKKSELIEFINFLRYEIIQHQLYIKNIKNKIKTTRLSTFEKTAYLCSMARHIHDIINLEKEIDKCFFLTQRNRGHNERGESNTEEVIDAY